MTADSEVTTHCAACGEAGLSPLRNSDSRLVCRCGSICYLSPPDETELDAHYREAWSSDRSHATGATSEHIATQLAALPVAGVAGKRCLDWGAGKGEVARALERAGALITAYEPYGAIDENSKFSWVRSVDEISCTFDYIFMVEVIEHLANPVEKLAEVRQLLAPNGTLVITTPNAKGVNSRLSGGQWREVANPTHLLLFSETGLARCLNRAGFRVGARHRGYIDFGKSGASALAARLLNWVKLDGSLRMTAFRD